MATVVFLGHGGFNPTSGSYPGEVLVPPDTTLRYFSDAGQALTLPAVTYDYRLRPEDTEEESTLALSLNWGATVVTLPAGSPPWYLCQGTPDTCPTPALNVAVRPTRVPAEPTRRAFATRCPTAPRR